MAHPENGTSKPRFAHSVLAGDLIFFGEESHADASSPRFATFQVLSYALSKLDILPGDILKLQTLAKGEIPAGISIVAVRDRRSGEEALLLRLFLPPRQFFQITDRVFRPLVLDCGAEIVAAAGWQEGCSPWRARLS